VPPGSARDKVVVELVKRGVVGGGDTLLYEDLRRKVELGGPLKRKGDQFYVGEELLIDYLKRDTTLGYALRQRKVVIAPRDTWEALLIRDVLVRELEREKTWTIGDVEKLVKVVFLPAHYQKGDEELAKVDYRRALGGVVKKASGYSPSLQRLAANESRLAQEALDIFSALDPRRYFGEGLRPIIAGAAISVGLAALTTLGAGPLALALAAVFSEKWANLLAESGKEGLKELLASVFKRGGGDLRQLFASALKALRYVDDQRVEARVDEAAAKWGLTMEDFKALLQLLAGKIATKEELEKLKTLGDEEFKKAVEELVEEKWEEVKRELEERVAALEKEVKEMRKEFQERIRLLNFSPGSIYIGAEEWLYVEEVGGEVWLKRGLLGGGPLVYNSLIDVVAERLRWAAERGGGVVVVKGGKGVGKSTATVAAVYHLLKGAVEVGGRVYKPIAIRLGSEVSRDDLQNFVDVANRFGYLPVFYFDPSALPAYPEEASGEYVPEAPAHVVKEVVALLFDVTKPERRRVVALVALSNDQYKVVEGEISKRVESGARRWLWVIDADEELEEEKADFVKDLVENYSGCRGDAVKRVADTIASQFADGYAVAAVLAADWLKRGGCSGEEVERAVERARGDVHRFVLDYIWHAVLGRDENVARWAAPLILAVGLYGPHPPRLGEAVAVAMSRVVEGIFGAGSVRRDENALKWLTQPLHGILYEAIEKVARGAVYRRFGVGGDELCQGSGKGPCRLVEICTRILEEIPCEKCNTAADIEEEYAKWAANRFINDLIQAFLRVYDGKAHDGRWRIRYETEQHEGVKTVEEIVDELDVLSALYGLAVLPVWHPQLKPLEGWFFVGGRKVGVVAQYLYSILKERGGKLVERAAAIVDGARRRGFYTTVDNLRVMGIAAAGPWDSATDEDLEKSVELAASALSMFATASPIVLVYVWPLLSEAWRRVAGGGTHEGGERRQRLADKLIVLMYNAARGNPHNLLLYFAIGVERPNLETVARRFDVLYNAASNAGKMRLLEALLIALDWDVEGVNVAAVLLGKPWLIQRGALEEAYKRIKGFVSRLNGVEKAYVVASLYPLLAKRYASFGEFGQAVELAKEALKELKKLQSAYDEDKESTEKRLRPYLELWGVKPDLGKELNDLSRHVYYYVALVYMVVDELDKAVEYAEKACVLAKKLGDEYYEVLSCSLPPRLKAVRGGVPPAEEFEKVWQRASRAAGTLGAEAIAITLGEYVVALASAGRLSDVEKVLEKWGVALELHPGASALTYGVLSLFDGRHVEKAVGYLPEWARANLPWLADVLHDAVEAGVFSEEPKAAVSARETLKVVYGRDVVETLLELASASDNLLLSALVGLAYCKRGEEWGLKLAKAAARAGSQRFKDIVSRLFGELAKALEGATVGICVTDEVLRAVYKLYYFHV